MYEQVQCTVDVVELHAGLHGNPATVGAKVRSLCRQEYSCRDFLPSHRHQFTVRQTQPPTYSVEQRPGGASCAIHQPDESTVVERQGASEGTQRVARISREATIELGRESVAHVHSRA